jgi:hypothetical protein
MVFLLAVFSVFDYSLNAGAVLSYDDNIFSYSRHYLDEFIAHTHPERFPFETYDDITADVGLELLLRNKLVMGRTTTMNFGLSTHGYYINKEKDYTVYELGIRQSFDRFAVKIEYLFMPAYLIRYYQDPAGTDYLGCRFTEHLMTMKGTCRVNAGLNVTASLKREFDNYIETFDVYDSESYRFEAGVDLRAADFFEPDLAYEFKDSRAQGPVPDVSYVQHQARMTFVLRTKVPRLSVLTIDYLIAYRLFTTDLGSLVDSPHSGRSDLRNRIRLAGEVPVLTGLRLVLNYTCEFRNSFSDAYPQIGELKDYREQTAGTGIEFKY